MTSKKQSIEVFSSFSIDKIIHDRTGEVTEKLSGPALFIKNVFDGKVGYKLHTAEKIYVEIHKDDINEFGFVPKAPMQKIANFGTNWALVSTVLGEWMISSPLPKYLFIDIQGFMRAARQGDEGAVDIIERLAGEVFCLKGTREEVAMLSNDARAKQATNGLLISTDGESGVTILSQKDRIVVEPRIVVKNSPDTIGAGDTWFANFILCLYRHDSVLEATDYANKYASMFLSQK